jgi:hypothetical protein
VWYDLVCDALTLFHSIGYVACESTTKGCSISWLRGRYISLLSPDTSAPLSQTSLEWLRPGTLARLEQNLVEQVANAAELEKIRSSRHHRNVVRVVVDATTDPLVMGSWNLELVELSNRQIPTLF